MTHPSTNQPAVLVQNLGKTYHIYDRPQDRLKQILLGKRATYYREFEALKNINFCVQPGETLGIVGRNGSGKSTLLQLVVGTSTPTAGQVQVRGRVAALLELGAGFNPEFTGRENVYLNAGILGLSKEEISDRFKAIVAFAEIGDFLDQPVKTYSSGMFVRLAFAVAIHVEPDVLVIDEALAVGDEAFQRKCFARIQTFKKQGGTLLFVSHSAGAIVELCDRAICLDGGEMLCAGSPKQVVALYHKLIYALPERVAAIKATIQNDGGEALLALDDRVEEEQEQKHEPHGLHDDYDPNLKPTTTTVYQDLGCLIEDPHLQTLKGERVNILVNRREYVYTYRATFAKDAFNVRFGMLIKTTSGFEIGGAVTAPVSRGVDVIPCGTEYEVRFRFRAALAPGVYFLNAGILGMVDGAEVYLARMIDVGMFRVQVDPLTTATAQVDFLIEPSAAVKGKSSELGSQA